MKYIQIAFDIVRYFLLYLCINLVEAFARTMTEDNTLTRFFVELSVSIALAILLVFIAKKFDDIRLQVNFFNKSIIYSTTFTFLVFTFTLSLLSLRNHLSLLPGTDTSTYIQTIFFALYVGVRGCLEEVFYRGVLFSIVKKSCSVVATIFITSILFAFAHTYVFNFFSFYGLNMFCMGLLYASVRMVYNNVGAAVIFHFIWNVCAAITGSRDGINPLISIPSLNGSTSIEIQISTSIAAFVFSCGLLGYYYYKNSPGLSALFNRCEIRQSTAPSTSDKNPR